MSWISWSVGDEDTVEVMGRLVDRVVVWQASHACTTAHNGANDVLLDTAVEQGNVSVSIGRWHVERRLGRHSLHQVDAGWVLERLILVGVVLLTDGDLSKGGTLLT